MNEATTKLIERGTELALVYGVNVLSALAILIIGWIAARWVGRLTNRALDRVPHMDQTIRPIVSSLVRYSVLVFVIIAVLARFGVETTSIIAVFGAAGLAVGLALQGTLSNIAAGVMLLFLRPFHVDEYIEAGGISGTVEEIGLFTTRLKTIGGLFISAPNSTLWGSTIINYSRNPERRIDLVIGISYNDDIDGASHEMTALMKSDNRILGAPEPLVLVTGLADSCVNLNLRCWTKSGDYWPTLSDLTKSAKVRLEEKGYSIPFPQREMHIVSDKSKS
ncbi:MAG: mechanosensitive ion channel [Rhodospirillaceae bacterium]|nr:mechanosensitive ion channel [Rhodospirillaceae bacterium]